MMKARDVMSVEIVSIGPDATILDAVETMLEHGVSGLPVLARDGVLMGILTEGDLMGRVELRRAQAWFDKPVVSAGEGLETYIKAHGEAVRDVMSRDVITADDDAGIDAVAELMARHHVKRVLVMRGEKVAGIVSRADLIRGIVTSHRHEEVPSSDQARRTVLNRLHVELGLPRKEIGATVSNGKILLWGMVGSEEELRAARVAAESVVGRGGVVSYLRVEAGRQNA